MYLDCVDCLPIAIVSSELCSMSCFSFLKRTALLDFGSFCDLVQVQGKGERGRRADCCMKPGLRLRTARHPSQEKDGGEGKGKGQV